MNKHIVEGKWEQFKAAVKKKYAKLTDDELLEVKANSQKLSGYLQAKYGLAKDEAEKEAKDFKEKFQ
ncbi:CsbD family protein [Pseudofrancisella aestuarii]|uniref:CsbD family protein n=1 Tax=Pseudofrancisella aestuarii TaxID=2670347 RepID=A0ABV9TBG8_9GAMM|nr:CsbD family protein [Pseudofrancisella aestuarii]